MRNLTLFCGFTSYYFSLFLRFASQQTYVFSLQRAAASLAAFYHAIHKQPSRKVEKTTPDHQKISHQKIWALPKSSGEITSEIPAIKAVYTADYSDKCDTSHFYV